MASTPEGKVKAAVKKALQELQAKGVRVYYHMPVQNGMGKPTLDFIGCIEGRFFAIETKAPGKTPTERQQTTISEIQDGGGAVIWTDTTNTEELMAWLLMLSR